MIKNRRRLTNMKKVIRASSDSKNITVGDLKRWLSGFDDNDAIVVAEGSRYVYGFDVFTSLKKVKNQQGPDFDAVVIITKQQIGEI